MRGRRRRARRSAWGGLGAAVVLVALTRLPVAVAPFHGSAASGANVVEALVVTPPAAASAVVTAVASPPSCRAELAWPASPTPGVTGYEVERIVAAGGAVEAGPWTVTATAHVDEPVPLRPLVDAPAWRVRAVRGGWRSAWVTAAADDELACGP